jgi:hypothetical protein
MATMRMMRVFPFERGGVWRETYPRARKEMQMAKMMVKFSR